MKGSLQDHGLPFIAERHCLFDLSKRISVCELNLLCSCLCLDRNSLPAQGFHEQIQLDHDTDRGGVFAVMGQKTVIAAA